MTPFQRFVTWFELHEPFNINNWPLGLNEPMSGLLLLPILLPTYFMREHWYGPVAVVLIYAIVSVLSYLYEHGTLPWKPAALNPPDPHGWNVNDWADRQQGLALVCLLWCMLLAVLK